MLQGPLDLPPPSVRTCKYSLQVTGSASSPRLRLGSRPPGCSAALATNAAPVPSWSSARPGRSARGGRVVAPGHGRLPPPSTTRHPPTPLGKRCAFSTAHRPRRREERRRLHRSNGRCRTEVVDVGDAQPSLTPSQPLRWCVRGNRALRVRIATPGGHDHDRSHRHYGSVG